MRNFKRFLTLALAVMMVVSMFAFNTSAATAFTDIDADDEYLAKAVNLLNYVGVIKGTSATTFDPDALVTREQMAAFLYRLMNKGKSVDNGANTSTFTDLDQPLFYFAISWANSKGFVKGTSATTFNPKGNITLQDAYTMVVRALGYETEEALPYPFGHIGVAEGKNVGLDEGLDSSIGYGDALTRGDVAIILYNAFFAETGVPETEQIEDYIGTEGEGNWVLRTETVYPVFCEKYFDVLEVEYQVVATPAYYINSTLNNNAKADATTKSFGYDAVQFELVEFEGEEDVPKQFYADFEDLGVDGDVNDYIMAHFKMYITLDKDNEVEEILYAESLLTKKTINEIEFETLDTNTKNSYFGSSSVNAKLFTGKVKLGDETAYLYNAPYAYAKPNYRSDLNKTEVLASFTDVDSDGIYTEGVDTDPVYTTVNKGITDSDKYLARNAENLELITMSLNNSNTDDEYKLVKSFTWYDGTLNDAAYATLDGANYAAYATDVINQLSGAYMGRQFAADIYDVNGDGLYDYMLYKPYTFAIADGNSKKDFRTDNWSAGSVAKYGPKSLYIGEAEITGAEIADGDAFFGWISPANNKIEVAEVIEPVDAGVTNMKKTTGTLTLDNGETVSAVNAWKVVGNADGAYTVNLASAGYVLENVKWSNAGLLQNSIYDDDEYTFYIYDGAVLYAEGVKGAVSFDGENLIIITNDVKNGNKIVGESWSAGSGNTTYAYAWVDGELKYVPVEKDTDKTDVFPGFVGNDGDTTVANYEDKIATYSVDKNGVYTLTLLNYAWDVATEVGDYTKDSYLGVAPITKQENSKYILDNKEDDTIQAIYETGTGSYKLTKYGLNRFELLDNAGNEITVATGYTLPDLLITDNTRVIIRNEYTKNSKQTVDFVEYTMEDLTESIANTLTNVQIILQNNTKYTDREELVLLYAETNDNTKLNLNATKKVKADRIVKTIDVEYIDEEYVNLYTLYNPYTGETETAYGTATQSSANATISTVAIGDVVVLKSGKVDDETGYTPYGSLATVSAQAPASTNYGLFWVLGYDAEEEMIEVVRYDTAAKSDWVAGMNEENVNYASFAKNVTYRINVENAPVVMLSRGNQGWDFKYTSMTVKNADVLNGEDESVLAFNSSYEAFGSTADDELETVYGNNVKVYLNIDPENGTALNNSVKDADTGAHGEAAYVVIVANAEENAAYCAVKEV